MTAALGRIDTRGTPEAAGLGVGACAGGEPAEVGVEAVLGDAAAEMVVEGVDADELRRVEVDVTSMSAIGESVVEKRRFARCPTSVVLNPARGIVCGSPWELEHLIRD